MLAEAIDAPEAVKLVTVAVVNSATPAFMLAIDASVAVRAVMVPLVMTAVPTLAEATEAPVAVRDVTAATPAFMEAADTVVTLTLPVASSIVIDAVPSLALMFVTSRLVRSRVVVLTVVMVAVVKTAEAAETVVKLPTAGDDPPMVVASIVPPLMSTKSNI